MILPETNKYLEKDKFIQERYGEKIYNCIEEVCKSINMDAQMHQCICCKDNRYEDLYEMFIEKIETFFPIGEDVHDPMFSLYNVMHRTDFYEIWTNDLIKQLIQQEQ